MGNFYSNNRVIRRNNESLIDRKRKREDSDSDEEESQDPMTDRMMQTPKRY